MSEQSPPETDKKKTREQELMLLLLLRLREQIHDLVSLYAQDFDHELFGRRMLQQLEMAHTEAGYYGRVQAGNTSNFGVYDRKHAQIALAEQAVYLKKFIADVKSGKYKKKEVPKDTEAADDTGSDGGDSVADTGGEDAAVDDDEGGIDFSDGVSEGMYARADLYGSAIIGTFNEMFVLYSPTGTVIWWVTSTEPCAGCAELSVNSPYPISELPAVPGDGSTPCLSRCRCSLIRDDGVSALFF